MDVPAWQAWLIWSFGPALFFYAFFQRVAPSIMIDPLMRDLNIQGAVLGNLSAFYFYSYALMQIPVGLLMNRFGPRRLMTFGAGVCALGTLLFAMSHSLPMAYAGTFAGWSRRKFRLCQFSDPRQPLVAEAPIRSVLRSVDGRRHDWWDVGPGASGSLRRGQWLAFCHRQFGVCGVFFSP